MNFDGLKPTGSDKITNTDKKTKRLLELSLPKEEYEKLLKEEESNKNGKENLKESKKQTKEPYTNSPSKKENKNLEKVIKEVNTPDNNTYAIVQERGSKFFIKKKDKNGVYQYIGGKENLNEHCYPNEKKAAKNLNFIIKEINQLTGYKTHTDALRPGNNKVLKENHNSDKENDDKEDRTKEIDDLAKVNSDEMNSDDQYRRTANSKINEAVKYAKILVNKGGLQEDQAAKFASQEFKEASYNDIYSVLQEKAESKDQQKSAGAALAAKRGETDPSELKGASKDMYDSMSQSELEDYASGVKENHNDKEKKGVDGLESIEGDERGKPDTNELDEENENNTQYKNLFFAQGEDADEYLEILDEKGPEATINYITDMVDENTMDPNDIENEKPSGKEDKEYETDDYVLTWNSRLNYIGLVRKVSGNELDEENEIKVDDENYDNTLAQQDDELNHSDMKMTENNGAEVSESQKWPRIVKFITYEQSLDGKRIEDENGEDIVQTSSVEVVRNPQEMEKMINTAFDGPEDGDIEVLKTPLDDPELPEKVERGEYDNITDESDVDLTGNELGDPDARQQRDLGENKKKSTKKERVLKKGDILKEAKKKVKEYADDEDIDYEADYNHEEEIEPEDIVISSNGFEYNVGEVEGKHIGTTSDEEEAIQIANNYMEKNEFWPNLWFQNDHGNINLIDKNGDQISEYAPSPNDSFKHNQTDRIAEQNDSELPTDKKSAVNKLKEFLNYVQNYNETDDVSIDTSNSVGTAKGHPHLLLFEFNINDDVEVQVFFNEKEGEYIYAEGFGDESFKEEVISSENDFYNLFKETLEEYGDNDLDEDNMMKYYEENNKETNTKLKNTYSSDEVKNTVQKVVDLLNKQGYSGLDMDAEENFVEYGIIYNENTGDLIKAAQPAYEVQDIESPDEMEYQLFNFSPDDIEEMINNGEVDVDEIADMTGMSVEEWKNQPASQKILDIDSYSPFDNPLDIVTLNELPELLEGQETLTEEEKFVLDTGESDQQPTDDDTSDEQPEEEPSEQPDEEPSEEDDPVKQLQKHTGKLSYLINQHKDDPEVMDTDMIKYVVNGILDNLDFSQIDEDTKENFISQIQGDDEGNENNEDDMEGPENADDIAVGDETASAAPMAGGDAGGGDMGGGDAMEESKKKDNVDKDNIKVKDDHDTPMTDGESGDVHAGAKAVVEDDEVGEKQRYERMGQKSQKLKNKAKNDSLNEQELKEIEKTTGVNLQEANSADVVEMFINDTFPKDKKPVWGVGNIKIAKVENGWVLVHYDAPILFRDESGNLYFDTEKHMIPNKDKPSQSTTKLQNYIKEQLPKPDYEEVNHEKINSLIQGLAINENLNEENNPCWEGYEQYGTKTQNGEEVPNCVPVEENNTIKEVDDREEDAKILADDLIEKWAKEELPKIKEKEESEPNSELRKKEFQKWIKQQDTKGAPSKLLNKHLKLPEKYLNENSITENEENVPDVETMKKKLEQEFPNAWFEIDNSGENKIIITGENAYVDEKPIYDYYNVGGISGEIADDLKALGINPNEMTSDYEETSGVHKKLDEFLDKHGYIAEPYDAGTVHITAI